ncbi:MAG: heavy-metal-associated domain-containing protein [Ignavibacteria bacterium]|nr:heavy-metal-associated domain-containing protein [Ignavibacteria bacterium]
MKKLYIIIFVLSLTVNFVYSNFIFKNNLHSNDMRETVLVAEKTITIKCSEMSCKACKQSITKAINKIEGIIKLDINLEDKIITVVLDESKTDGQAVLNAIIGAGYDAELIN